MTYANKNAFIVCIAIQLIFNFCFIWYLADTRKTTHSKSIVDLSDIESRLSDVESSKNTISNNNWYEESQRKQQLDRIEQEQQRVRLEQLWKD